MKPALATCAAGPPAGWLGWVSAVPSTVPSSSSATTVRPGGCLSHIVRACSSEVSGAQLNVSPAATMSCRNGQIAGQSSGVASRMITPPRLSGQRAQPSLGELAAR